MTDAKPVSAPASIDLSQLVSALQAMGITITPPQVATQSVQPASASEPTPIAATQSASDTGPRTVSARISSPWVLTSVVPKAALASDTVQQQVPSSAKPSATDTVTVQQQVPSPSKPSATTAPDDTPSGFTCPHCHRPSGEAWYTVTAGRNVGVFSGWHRVQPLVSGVPHASYRKYSSEAVATAAFEDAIAEGLVVVIN